MGQNRKSKKGTNGSGSVDLKTVPFSGVGKPKTTSEHTNLNIPVYSEQDVQPVAPKVSGWIKGFVFFHLLAITVWAIPLPPETVSNNPNWKIDTSNFATISQGLNFGFRLENSNYLKNSPLKFYDLMTGFWQYWDMFAPNPADMDWYATANVTFKDGSVEIYHYPRMYKIGIFQKYIKERYRKFYERAHDDSSQYFWPVFAQYVAFVEDKTPTNPPVKVDLIRNWQLISPPGKPVAVGYQHYKYYTYIVNQGQLTRDKEGN